MIAKARELLAVAPGGIMQASDKPAPMRSLAPLSHRTLLAGLAQSDINRKVIQPPDRFRQ